MRWKKQKKPAIKLGSIKLKVCFAFFPVLCQNKTYVWLEKYTETKQVVKCVGHIPETSVWYDTWEWRVIRRDVFGDI